MVLAAAALGAVIGLLADSVSPESNPWMYGGALACTFGLLALLLRWLTGKLSQSVDANTKAIAENTQTSIDTRAFIERIGGSLDNLVSAVHRNSDKLEDHGRISSEEQKQVIRTVQDGNAQLIGLASELAKEGMAATADAIGEGFAAAARKQRRAATRPKGAQA